MIANPAISLPGGVPPGFTLNDLRVRDTIEKEPSPTSKLTLYSMGLGVVLAIGALIWLDPLHLFTPIEASAPAHVSVPASAPVLPTERQELVAPLPPVPETKSVEVPIATGPVTRVPQVPARVVQPRAASIKPNATVPLASPMQQTAPPTPLTKLEEPTALPALVTKPEEKTDTPIVPKVGDDTKNAPKPAATNDPAPVTE